MPKVKIIKRKDVTPEARSRYEALRDAHLAGLEFKETPREAIVIGAGHRPITIAVSNWINEAKASIAERKDTEKRQFLGLQNSYIK